MSSTDTQPNAVTLLTSEFNSSTDTYTSDSNNNKDSSTADKMSDPLNQNSFDRNFDMDSDLVETTIGKPITIDNDEFSFIQLKSHNNSASMDETVNDVKTTPSPKKHLPNSSSFASPSKSALKKPQAFASPKKNVVFESDDPEVIHYTENHDSSMNEDESDAKNRQLEDEKFSNQIEETLNHNWKQVRQSSVSSEDATPPPMPPPHAVGSNFEAVEDPEHKPEDVDRNTLHEFKLHSKNLDNLSLNDKLEIFLNNQNQQNRSEVTTKELDQHLQDLEAKSQYDLQNNIHHLSLDLQNKLNPKMEDPLNSLSKSTEVPLRSAGSSQSSLQSLMDNNRMLQLQPVDQVSKGIQLNDGIHGFSNDLVEKLIPQENETLVTTNIPASTGDNDASDESQLLTLNAHKRHSAASFASDLNEEFHDSFDNDYNNTEQSIMNLLTSAASKSQEQLDPQNEIGTETNPIVKEEPSDFVSLSDPIVKRSPSTENFVFKEDTEASESKLVIEPITKPVLKATDSDVSYASDRITDGSEPESPVEHHFRISDHIDQGWKFEDSLDADREDNDEYTDGNVTLLSQHQVDGDSFGVKEEDDRSINSEISKQEVKNEPALEVNLSPDTSLSIEESPDRVSLAPPRSAASLQNSPVRSLVKAESSLTPPSATQAADPESPLSRPSNKSLEKSLDDLNKSLDDQPQNSETRTLRPTKSIDVAIDATVPPTPVRIARENKLKQKYGSISPPPLPKAAFEPSNSKSPFISSNEVVNDKIEADTKESKEVTNIPLPEVPAEDDIVSNEVTDSSLSTDQSGTKENINEPVDPVPSKEVEAADARELEDPEVLANSTTVAPPEEITLPPIEANNYSSFEEITKTLNNSKELDSYEQSLSAEFDEEKPSKTTSYLSIWHSQSKAHKSQNALHMNRKSLDASNISIYDPASNTFKIPAGLLNKKIKEVNVMSRKVVDPNDVDYEVKDFLPELSEDSGFEAHFNNMVNISGNDSGMYSNTSGNRLSKTPLSERNILTNSKHESTETIDTYPGVSEPVTGTAVPARLNSYPKTLKPSAEEPVSESIQRKKPITQISQKRSKFRVPSIEIKKSMAAAGNAGTRDKYNDIFNDTTDINTEEPAIFSPPTIKGHGMKTLPSMDKDDVRKIMNTKRIISQEEYSQLKLVGQKSSVVNDNDTNMYDYLQQQASLHQADTSYESGPFNDNNSVLPHIAGELMKDPKALMSKEQVFNDSDIQSTKSRLSSIINTDYNPNQTFPEPDPELINSPAGGIFKTPPKDYEGYENDEVMLLEKSQEKGAEAETNKENRPPALKLQTTELESTPAERTRPTSPIKIGSPIKLIKKGSTTSVVIGSPKKNKSSTLEPRRSVELRQASGQSAASSKDKASRISSGESVKITKQFNGSEIANSKLRQREPSAPVHNEKKLSVVSVPSMYTNNTEPSQASSYTLLNQVGKQNPGWKQHSIQSSVVRETGEPLPMERGRLFFRVIGFKDIRLPDIDKNNGEFSVTLDNGVHCIRTPNYKLESSSVLIGKEFELTVGDSLEFILTMKMAYEKPKGSYVEVRERKLVKSKSRISRIFGTKEVVTTTKFVPQEAVDSWAGKFAQDGSFGRCYVDLEQYENKITYNPNSFDIPVFNEWEVSKISKTGEHLKPYVIGKLEVKMLFIPRVEAHEALPNSIKSCHEVINQLLQEKNIQHEGYMTQDGGDCESLKRRYFKLQGTSLIAHSEYSHKTRAKINMTKITDVIYVDNEKPETSKNARNFSDVLLVPGSFKIKFANGEIIDFGAENINDKYRWINIFETIAQHNRFRRLPWVKEMLKQVANKTNNPWYNPGTNEFR